MLSGNPLATPCIIISYVYRHHAVHALVLSLHKNKINEINIIKVTVKKNMNEMRETDG